MGQALTGTIARPLHEKGFGFIRPDGGGDDVFLHVRSLAAGDEAQLVPGARVSYEMGQGQRGRTQAVNIRILESPAEEDGSGLDGVQSWQDAVQQVFLRRAAELETAVQQLVDQHLEAMSQELIGMFEPE